MYKSSRAAGLCKSVSTGAMPGPIHTHDFTLFWWTRGSEYMALTKPCSVPELAEAGLQSCHIWESPGGWVCIELILLLFHVGATWWKGEKSIWGPTDQEALYRCTCLRFLSSLRLGSNLGLAVSCLHRRCSHSDTNGLGASLSAQSRVVSLDMHIHSGSESGLSVLSFPERNLCEKKLLKTL